MILKKSVSFSSQNYKLKYHFYSNLKQFQVFKIAKFEFKETVYYTIAYWQNVPSCDPLILLL